MGPRTFVYGLLLILGMWLASTLILAAEAAWQSTHRPAAPRPATTPQANTHAAPVNCHQSNPPTTSPSLAVARADAERAGIDVLTFTWQIWRESLSQADVVSPAGAMGIAPFRHATAAGMGIDPRDPEQALAAAARLDANHLHQFEHEARAAPSSGNAARYAYGLTLAADNAGLAAASWAWNQAYRNGPRWPTSGPRAWLWLLGRGNKSVHPGHLRLHPQKRCSGRASQR